MKKIIKILLLSLLFSSCATNYEEREQEEFQKVQNLFKNEYHVVLGRNQFQMKYYEGDSHSLSLFPGEEIPKVLRTKEPIKYKSKYFKDIDFLQGNNEISLDRYNYFQVFANDNNEKERAKIPFFKNHNYPMFFMAIDYYGLRPYVLNELIYDKSKGNDFEKIEEIFDKYYNMTYQSQDWGWDCGLLDKRDYGKMISFMYVQDKKCVLKKDSYDNDSDIYSIDEVRKYGEKFEQYFSKERDFDKINWQEFLDYNNITPVLNFYARRTNRLSEKKARKILKKISPYYNKKTYIITLDAQDENGKWITVW